MQPSNNYTALPCGLLVPQYVAEQTTRLSPSDVYAYRQHLLRRGRAKGTVEKYLRDIRTFVSWIGTEYLSALRVRAWAEEQLNKKKTATVNGSLAALNGFFRWIGRPDCVLQFYRVQESPYREDERDLSETEFQRLLGAADARTRALLLTFRRTGIRVSELRFFTVETARTGRVTVRNKGKTREVFLDRATRTLLLDYCGTIGLRSGVIFQSRGGAPLSRVAIWQLLKRTAVRAKVALGKVFPHNLRHLFAVERYKADPDIEALRLDLGHSLIATTQRYLKQTVSEHFARIERRAAEKKPPAGDITNCRFC